jgi:hypothetical protein
MTTFSERLVLGRLSSFMAPGSSVVGSETGKTDALDGERKAVVVLTTDEVLIATRVRLKTVLTSIPRSDIISVTSTGDGKFAVTFDDFVHAVRRVVEVDLSKRGDRAGIAAALGAAPPDAPSASPPAE